MSDETPPQDGSTVPYTRFYDVNQRMKTAEARVAELEGAVETVKSDAAKQVSDLAKTQQSEIESIHATHAEDLVFARTGVDDDIKVDIRTAWNAEPEDTRGKNAAEWWKSNVSAYKAHNTDPDKYEAPKLHPTVAVLLPGDSPGQRGKPAPGRGQDRSAGPTIEGARGKGRAAMKEALQRKS